MDAAKVILIAEEITVPDTYREYFLSLVAKDVTDEVNARVLAKGVRLRNILAHRYLDIHWEGIGKFLNSDWKVYETFLNSLKGYI